MGFLRWDHRNSWQENAASVAFECTRGEFREDEFSDAGAGARSARAPDRRKQHQLFSSVLHFGTASVPVLVISTIEMVLKVSRNISTRSGVSQI